MAILFHMSPWVRTIFLEWLPWLLLMNRPGKQFKKPKRKRRRRPAAEEADRREMHRAEQMDLIGGGRNAAAPQHQQRVFPAPLTRASESTTSRSTVVGGGSRTARDGERHHQLAETVSMGTRKLDGKIGSII
jgi:hypothetical protein